METILIKSKDKATSKLLQQLLKEIKGVQEVAVLKPNQKEDIALANAMIKGKTEKYVNTDKFLDKLKNASTH